MLEHNVLLFIGAFLLDVRFYPIFVILSDIGAISIINIGSG